MLSSLIKQLIIDKLLVTGDLDFVIIAISKRNNVVISYTSQQTMTQEIGKSESESCSIALIVEAAGRQAGGVRVGNTASELQLT